MQCMHLVKPEEIKKFINEGMQVPQWLCHAQAIERGVNQVIEAAGMVYTIHITREDQEASRLLMSRSESKQDLMNHVA